MPRQSKRDSPKPPITKDLTMADWHLEVSIPPVTRPSHPAFKEFETGIMRNWNLPKSDINTCIDSVYWPKQEADPRYWHIDIIRLLHEASTIDVRGKSATLSSNNDIFKAELACEISRRQSRNKSRRGQVFWMTVPDLNRVIKSLRSMAEDLQRRTTRKPGSEVKDTGTSGQKSGLRRGRSRASNGTSPEAEAAQQEDPRPMTRNRGRPRNKKSTNTEQVKPDINRQASDLPIRPARKLRSVKSPKAKPIAPPPVTPANPPDTEDSNEEEEGEDQENEPPEPVSGRHIYGDFIKPTTIDFIAGADNEAPAQAKTRQTRKRGRADNENPPTEEQIDSDPRDIDATGFLSELDPKEAMRRRKPRLSRLQQDPVLEPAWSQDVLVLPETPLLTPATEGMLLGTPAAPAHGDVRSLREPVVDGDETTSLGFKMLMDLLPAVPDHATDEEKSMLEDGIALIHRKIVAYKTSVQDILERKHG